MSLGPARGPHSGLCAAPFPMPCLTPSRLRPASQGLLGPQRPSSCLRAHQPRSDRFTSCREVVCSVLGSLGREPQQKAYGSAGGVGPRCAHLGAQVCGGGGGGVGGTRRPGFAETWS